MNTHLAATSDIRRPVVQPETNADRPKALNTIRTVKDLRERLKVTPPSKVLRLLATSPLSPRCKVLLQALWCRAVWRSGEVHPSTSEADLLTDTAMDRSTLYRAMADLEKAELVNRKRAYGRHHAQYVLPWVCEQKTAETRPGIGCHAPPAASNSVSPNPGIGCHLACAKGVEPLPLPSQPSEPQHPTPPPPALPPTAERQDRGAGGATRLHSTADGERQPLTVAQQAVKDFLAGEGIGMWSGPAERLARSGTTLEAAEIAWAEVKASDRTLKPRALEVRLTENRDGYEREANNREGHEALQRTKQTDPVLYALLCPSDFPLSLEPIPECQEWFRQRILGPANEAVGNRKGWTRNVDIMAQALVEDLRNGKAPLAAIVHATDALTACYSPVLSPLLAEEAMPQAVG